MKKNRKNEIIKLCINCKWYNNSLCDAPQNIKLDPVTGQIVHKGYHMCLTHRINIKPKFINYILTRIFGICGYEGRWFEPKIQGNTNG